MNSRSFAGDVAYQPRNPRKNRVGCPAAPQAVGMGKPGVAASMVWRGQTGEVIPWLNARARNARRDCRTEYGMRERAR